MPSRKKSSMFGCAFGSCVGSFVVICVALATPHWASSQERFSRPNGSVTVSLGYGLFRGTCEQFVDAGLQVSQTTFQVADALTGTTSRGLNVATIAMLVLALLCSLLSSGFTCTNTVSNPYQTFLGPLGVYTWNSSWVLTLLAMILFPVNVQGSSLSRELAHGCSSSLQTHLSSQHSYGYSYWILLLVIILNIASFLVIYFYDHATYSRKKEQERPIENAPKDVILF
uniref:Clarin 3 n=1 Tax=Malurus cyaneus samueli TaxID=2593467 RepID=A0A8C5TZV1_9PASS